MSLDIAKIAILTGMVDKLIQLRQLEGRLPALHIERMKSRQLNEILPTNIRFRLIQAKVFLQTMSRPTGMMTEKRRLNKTSGQDIKII